MTHINPFFHSLFDPLVSVTLSVAEAAAQLCVWAFMLVMCNGRRDRGGRKEGEEEEERQRRTASQAGREAAGYRAV